MKEKILLVDDEKDIIEFLQYNLCQEGFEVILAYNGKEALEKIRQKPDLIILDVLMPQVNGYEVCEKIREKEEYKNIPIIFLTAKSSETDEIHGLNIGADDFIQKPISPKKLVARVKSNLRKTGLGVENIFGENKVEIGPLKIDRAKFTVLLNKKEIVFPKKEFEILYFLALNPGKVFSREKILSGVWGNDIFVVERTVDVHIRKIREKLGKHSDMIETIKGVGYRFKSAV
ncbi:MAG: DNA-binding response regulator [Ignavibacteria bacterium RBG_13_36_8]|nr:MAG: DNA-binding response regulator [Ignavibacteria bacterium RBG_13_36_8]